MASSRPFLLASAPLESLDQATQLCLAAGGEYTAGDAQDKLNSSVIGEGEAWKTAWKGKTHQAIKMLERAFPGQPITALAVAGGPACVWERGELRNNFCPPYPQLCLKQLGDLEDLQAWLTREYGAGSLPAPAPEQQGAPRVRRATLAQVERASEKEAREGRAGYYSRENWMPDAAAAVCMNARCKSGGAPGQPLEFGFFRRRHHCRRCGGVFCDSCSSDRVIIVDSGSEAPHRVCAACVASLAEIVAQAQAEEQRQRQAAAEEQRQREAEAEERRQQEVQARAADAQAKKDAVLSEQWERRKTREAREAHQQSTTPAERGGSWRRLFSGGQAPLAPAEAAEAAEVAEAAARQKAANDEAAALAKVPELLANPAQELDVDEQISCLLACVAQGRRQAVGARGKGAVVVIGNTGAGKSSFINYLHGCAFERVKAAVRALPGRFNALSVPWHFPMTIYFVWGFCMGAQGA
jgi:hypothetical protein